MEIFRAFAHVVRDMPVLCHFLTVGRKCRVRLAERGDDGTETFQLFVDRVAFLHGLRVECAGVQGAGEIVGDGAVERLDDAGIMVHYLSTTDFEMVVIELCHNVVARGGR